MGRYTTYGIGGPAAYFISVTTEIQLLEALQFANTEELSYLILGKGSNCLFDDRGYQGLVIHNSIQFCNQEGPAFTVGAGYAFPVLGVRTSKLGYSGLEFAATIPGSVGGAVVMNAGAHGQETQQVLQSVRYVTEGGDVVVTERKDLEFGYRTSPFLGQGGAVVAATFVLTPSENAHQRQKEYLTKRMATQPLRHKSCGCIFRNPEGQSAGQLIDACGLKGRKWGNIVISEKHANFFINQGKGTAEDVLTLVKEVQEIVYTKTGVSLETELREIAYE